MSHAAPIPYVWYIFVDGTPVTVMRLKRVALRQLRHHRHVTWPKGHKIELYRMTKVDA